MQSVTSRYMAPIGSHVVIDVAVQHSQWEWTWSSGEPLIVCAAETSRVPHSEFASPKWDRYKSSGLVYTQGYEKNNWTKRHFQPDFRSLWFNQTRTKLHTPHLWSVRRAEREPGRRSKRWRPTASSCSRRSGRRRACPCAWPGPASLSPTRRRAARLFGVSPAVFKDTAVFTETRQGCVWEVDALLNTTVYVKGGEPASCVNIWYGPHQTFALHKLEHNNASKSNSMVSRYLDSKSSGVTRIISG